MEKEKRYEELDIEGRLKMFSELTPFTQCLYRIYKFVNGEKMPPFKCVLTPTDRCNLNCFFCPNSVARAAGRFKEKDELTDEEWINFVKEGIKFGINDWLILGGGEPWLRGEMIMKILEEIKKGVKIPYLEIFTNGSLFKSEEIARLVEMEVSRITFSFHGLSETYAEITGSTANTFLKVAENLRLLKKEKDGLGKKRPEIQVNIVVNMKNYLQIPEIIKFVNEAGVNIVALHPMRGFEETEAKVSPFSLTSEEISQLRKIVADATSLSKGFGIMLDTSPLDAFLAVKEGKPLSPPAEGPLENLLKLRCYEPWYGMLINPNGQVGRCTAFIKRDEPLNIKQMSLEEIWYGDYFNKVREKIKNNLPIEKCSECGLMSTTATLKKAFSMVNEWMRGNITFKELEKILDIGLKS